MKIPLEKISYDDLLKLSIEQRTQLFVKDKEIERLNNIINGLDNTIENLEEVIEHEDNIINKAIEYIEEKWNKESYYDDIDNCLKFLNINEYDKEELLSILKGDDKE